MENQLQSISKIFTEKLYRIPDYQRGYAWGEKQLKDYWNDIIQLEPGKNHYVGVLTLEVVPKETIANWEEDEWIIKAKSFEPFYVVDGQQRLTTTIILIQAITESIGEQDILNYTSINEIRKRYIFDSRDNGNSRSYIFGYEKDNPSYEFLKTEIFKEYSSSNYRKEITIYTNNLQYAKNYFREKLSKLTLTEKETIFRKVTQNLLFNIYSISSDIDVFIAFETMNNRGKPLSDLELLKNRLIYLSTKFEIEEDEKRELRKTINDAWKGIYHYLGKNPDKPLSDDIFLDLHTILYFGDEEYLRHHRIRYMHGMTKRSTIENYLLDEVFTLRNINGKKKRSAPIMTVRETRKYVETLQECVIIWYNINNPSQFLDAAEEERLLINKLVRLKYNSALVLISALYLKKQKKDAKIKFLSLLERFIFIDRLLVQPHYRNYINFGSLAFDVFHGKKQLIEIIKYLEDCIQTIISHPDFVDRIIDIMKKNGFYEWDGIRYFLYEYESSLKEQSKTRRNKINWDDFDSEAEEFVTVEHIYPQTAKLPCWVESFSNFNSKERKSLRNSLGNLLPLSKAKNSSLQNRCFKDKIQKGKGQIGYRYGSYSENEISHYSNWTSQEIFDRGMRLLTFMEERWRIDLQSDEKRAEILGLKFIYMGF
ncbi:DUF262 domain-containing protein [Chitinophaga qingshengii]|uniref:DUF262 domain-containing protein n=1 Tax=Chitinophaga qingshengii TaxID=1569794 RepID=A0ABR7TUG5_9BACT|nr:DUF262 domain-containing protein [Chitinophaga qingshengii]MBC9934130.1 DUF262 domain-containing protein [Chitinophaga qingshengii]